METNRNSRRLIGPSRFRLGLHLAALTFAVLAASCAPLSGLDESKTEVPDKAVFVQSSFGELANWNSTDPSRAATALKFSCQKLLMRADEDSMGGNAAYGQAKDWRQACTEALQLSFVDARTARAFFERHFQPVRVLNGENPIGLFTGYYEPELEGRLTKSAAYRFPIYSRPSDLVSVDLGNFRPHLKGERIAGRVNNGKLEPHFTRAQIEQSGVGPSSSPLVYVNDAEAVFFLHIQGSGRVKLPDGRVIRVAYDGQNGHPYTAIGSVLVSRGEIERSALSMQSIRAWLKSHPEQAQDLMNENASYVFFKVLPLADPTLGADGAQGVPLTSEASLAVDLKFHALGVPVWIESTVPSENASEADRPYARLLIAQDTGGAIRGPVRGDVYWGVGPRAEEIAGRMAHKGSMSVLLPKSAAQRLNPS